MGMCGISDFYYREIVNDKSFKKWKWQVKKCYDLYKGGTRFYGFEKRKERGENITFNHVGNN